MVNLNRLIDHTILKPDAISSDIERLCNEARAYEFPTVFVNPGWVALAADLLKGTGIKIGSVAGFPLGASTTTIKIKEAEQDIKDGAKEVDVVMNIGRFKEGDYKFVESELKEMRKVCANSIVLKIIIEASLLTDKEKVQAARMVKDCGADFVKTSTGFGLAGAKIEDVVLLRKAVGPDFGVKASGGIRDCHTALQLMEAGANRIGTSASVKIMEEYRQIQLSATK
jgi:deoxyribose-phosphate aldolase